MSKDANKGKVLTRIEREMFSLFETATERGIDTAMLYVKRNKFDLDDRVLEKLFDLVRNGAKDAFMMNVERTTTTLGATLDPFIRDDKDPLS